MPVNKKRPQKNGKIDGSGGLSKSYVSTISYIVKATLHYAAEYGYIDSLQMKSVAVRHGNPCVLMS